jgi:uroporphyrinogen-III synthase
MATEPAVLVTRPAGQANELCAGLTAAGFRPVTQPMLELLPLEQPDAASRQCLLHLDGFDHVIFISANAVRFGLDWIDGYWPQLPVGLHWYAIGERTAAMLSARGLAPLTPGDTMTSEGLLGLPSLQSVQGERVLIVRGVGGRETLRQALEARGAHVDSLVCYQRRPVALAPDALSAELEREAVALVLLSSGEGLAHFTALLPPGETTKLRELTVVVPSHRVAERAHALGWQRVRVADNATDDAMVEAARAWYAAEGNSE